MGNTFEQLAYWYLRLNGYFTVQNFVLHPEKDGSQRTEADLLAVRFPYHSEEINGTPMKNDCILDCVPGKIDFIIAEVKGKERDCCLNPTWTNSEKKNINYALNWFGIIDEKSKLYEISRVLYKSYSYEDDRFFIRFVCFGHSASEPIKKKAIQITHNQAIEFIRKRFKEYKKTKKTIVNGISSQ
jgi:hypothetical protein